RRGVPRAARRDGGRAPGRRRGRAAAAHPPGGAAGPIAVGLDFHAHMTAAMVDHATVIAGYRTYPHIDMGETAERAARTLVRALRGDVAPVIAWGSRPMMTSTLEHTPSRQPLKDVMDMATA